MIELRVEPDTVPMTWQKFTRTAPPRAIALDGYVKTGPRFNDRGPWINLNHHEEVSRLETRATCAQALICVRQGLFDGFVDDKGNAAATVFVNDCDEDVCLSVFILQNHHLATSTMNPRLNRLVFMEDMLDTTAGAYPFPKDLASLHEVLWVFEPYHRFRVSGQLDRRSADDFRGVIGDVGRRIMAAVAGTPGTIELDTRYKVSWQGVGWCMVTEIGKNARIGLYADGVRAFAAVRERHDGRFVYTLGRSAPFVPFPLPKLYKKLNEIEGCKGDKWGGSDIIGGSPRVSGSAIHPDELVGIIDGVI